MRGAACSACSVLLVLSDAAVQSSCLWFELPTSGTDRMQMTAKLAEGTVSPCGCSLAGTSLSAACLTQP